MVAFSALCMVRVDSVAIRSIQQFLSAFLGNEVPCDSYWQTQQWETLKVKWYTWLTDLSTCSVPQTNFPLSYPVKQALFQDLNWSRPHYQNTHCFQRDTHLPYEILSNHVSNVSHMVPGPHFGNVEFKPCVSQQWVCQIACNDMQ